MLTTCLHLELKLRMSGTTHPFPHVPLRHKQGQIYVLNVTHTQRDDFMALNTGIYNQNVCIVLFVHQTKTKDTEFYPTSQQQCTFLL